MTTIIVRTGLDAPLGRHGARRSPCDRSGVEQLELEFCRALDGGPSGVEQLELEFCRALDGGPDRAVDRTARHVMLERPLDLGAVDVGLDAQAISDMDPLDHKHAVFDLDLARCLTDEPAVACVDLTRLQRASEGAGESAAGGGDDVVERRRTLGISRSCDPVVLGDLVVDTEVDRLVLPWDLIVRLCRNRSRLAVGLGDTAVSRIGDRCESGVEPRFKVSRRARERCADLAAPGVRAKRSCSGSTR